MYIKMHPLDSLVGI